MKRFSVTGTDREPEGGHHLREEDIIAAGGVAEGDRVLIHLCDEPLECEAVVVSSPAWPGYLFARPVQDWHSAGTV